MSIKMQTDDLKAAHDHLATEKVKNKKKMIDGLIAICVLHAYHD